MSLDSYLPWTLFVSKHSPLTIIDLKISQRQWTKTSLLISNHLLLRRPMGNQKSEIITPQVYKQSTESSKDEDLLFGRFRDHWSPILCFMTVGSCWNLYLYFVIWIWTTLYQKKRHYVYILCVISIPTDSGSLWYVNSKHMHDAWFFINQIRISNKCITININCPCASIRVKYSVVISAIIYTRATVFFYYILCTPFVNGFKKNLFYLLTIYFVSLCSWHGIYLISCLISGKFYKLFLKFLMFHWWINDGNDMCYTCICFYCLW